MQTIQWFPGHMAKAVKMMRENLKFVQGVIIVLDARAPFACLNAKLDELFSGKKILYVINKSDTVKISDLQRVLTAMKKEGKNCVAVSSFDKKSLVKLKNELFNMFDDIISKNREKGIFKAVRVMVAGIPNTGKSTLINSLVGSKKAVTGDKAGVTRSGQWVKLSDLELFDTPGTMPPSFDNQKNALHLAYIGSVNDDILDMGDLALELIKELRDNYPELLKARYGLENVDKEGLELFDEICLQRGFVLKGRELDYDRCANAVIDDLRKGRIGKICFD